MERNFGHVLRGLKTFLWGLLLVIPGIIKSYEYRMIPYILSENPGMDTKRAFQLSAEMMYGQKWNAFVLDLSFILWLILGAITCGLVNVFLCTLTWLPQMRNSMECSARTDCAGVSPIPMNCQDLKQKANNQA